MDVSLVKGRMRVLAALRGALAAAGYAEVQTPLLQRSLSGFESGAGFSTYSASLGERLWLRAAPELYLKRLVLNAPKGELDRIYELAVCLRDELDDVSGPGAFDRPEFTLLELYAVEEDAGSLEGLLRDLLGAVVGELKQGGLSVNEKAFAGKWERRQFGDLLQELDSNFELERLLHKSVPKMRRSAASAAASDALAIEARASDPALRSAAANLVYQAGDVAEYLRAGPQGYWWEFVERAFRTRVAPNLQGPVIVEGFPLEASPLVQSDDSVHGMKWELYAGGVRVAIGSRELMNAADLKVRFQMLDRLRRLGYGRLPEPDAAFLAELEGWPRERPLIGMGIYVDRLAGILLGLLTAAGKGQERMLPNLFKP